MLPPQVRFDQQLPFSAKVLYAEVAALCDQQGYCWASNHYFATLYNVQAKVVSRWINQLRRRGYIHVAVSSGNQRKIFVQSDLLKRGSPPPVSVEHVSSTVEAGLSDSRADAASLLINNFIDNNDRIVSAQSSDSSTFKERGQQPKAEGEAVTTKEVLAPPSPPVARRPPPPNAELKQAANQRATASHPFVPPTLSEVEAYLQEQQALCPDRYKASEQAQRFVNYYQSNGWKVGRNPMQDWQAAANSWLLNMNNFHSSKPRHHETYSRLHTGGKAGGRPKDYSIPL